MKSILPNIIWREKEKENYSKYFYFLILEEYISLHYQY